MKEFFIAFAIVMICIGIAKIIKFLALKFFAKERRNNVED